MEDQVQAVILLIRVHDRRGYDTYWEELRRFDVASFRLVIRILIPCCTL